MWFPTGAQAYRLLLIWAFEAERGDVGARRHLHLPDVQHIIAARNDFPRGAVGIHVGAGRVDI